MARTDGKAENQHYVPKMLLRNFAISKEGSEQLYVYDKHKRALFPHPTGIKNLATERGYYDFEIADGITASLEQPLSVLEEKTNGAFNSLLSSKNLNDLTDDETGWLCVFATAQFLRSPQLRNRIKQTDELLKDHVRKMGYDPNEVANWSPFEGKEDVKQASIEFIRDSITKFSKMFLMKKLVLFETSNENPFMISDNPISLFNNNDYGPYGNIGLAVKGIQIHLPLSSTLTLGFWCPSIVNELKESLENAQKEKARLIAFGTLSKHYNQRMVDAATSQFEKVISSLQSTVDHIDSGSPIQCSQENMDFFNSLQIGDAYRFVMSSNPDFSLAERMMREKPHLSHGVPIKT